jgi:hypothetical protein
MNLKHVELVRQKAKNLETWQTQAAMEELWRQGDMKLNKHNHNFSSKGIRPAVAILFRWFAQSGVGVRPGSWSDNLVLTMSGQKPE